MKIAAQKQWLMSIGMKSSEASGESKHDPEIELAHMFMDLYNWSWKQFYEETPICVIHSLADLIKERLTKGFMGPREIMYFKCIARGKGSKQFDK